MRGSAQTNDAEWRTFAAADKNLSFSYPSAWKVAEEGTTLRLAAADGATYTLRRDSLSPAPTGDPANSAALRSSTAEMVKPLLKEAGYAGVKLLTVDSGGGAIYRYRGTGTKSGYDLAEVWVAFIGAHNVVLLQAAAPQPEHFYELSTLFKSLTFADAPKRPAGSGRPQPQAGASKPPASGAASTAQPAGTASADTTTRSAANGKTAELERYDGHLITGDGGFTLRIMTGNTATADWTRSYERAAYTGTYSGEDGTYLVHLARSGTGATQPADGLNLATKSTGGMVGGEYWSASIPAHRQIAELKLTEVESGNFKLRGTKSGQGQTNGAAGRNNARRGRNRLGAGTVVGGGINVIH
jgi:hypothetical protein